MGITSQYFDNYTQVGDILVMASCMIFAILIKTAYIKKTRNFIMLESMIVLLYVAAMANTGYHICLNYIGRISDIIIYALRIIYHFCIFSNLWMYVVYLKEPIHLNKKENRINYIISGTFFAFVMLYDILGTVFKFGYYINYTGAVHENPWIFSLVYFLYIAQISILFTIYSNRIFKKIRIAMLTTMCVSVSLVVIQFVFRQNSYTLATFIFPIYSILYLMHSNPYDIESGALDSRAFADAISINLEHNRRMLLMSLYMPDFDKGSSAYPMKMLATIRRFSDGFFKDANLFKLSGGHLVLCIDIKKNPDYEEKSSRIIEEFNKVYPEHRADYKIVTTLTWDKISENNDYAGFFAYIQDNMEMNSIYRAGSNDVMAYTDTKYITAELEDIYNKKDLADPRVLVYCQPVYNIDTGLYDTAEALMRLELPQLGMIFPDKFIPIAEKNGFINTLTQIILSKTCDQIREFVNEGYSFKRISVNFSAFDVQNDSFCQTVESIISRSGISFDKIAIEITETQGEQDFEAIKRRITELQGSGIKFYLDDFGTGYSNFERIMEIPFDIIKFDRSMVTGSCNDAKFKNLVSHLAKMFSDMNYAVLYEGIENESDEARCIGMNAKYLQGYKYSKPIPIAKLSDYFQKKKTG